MYDPLFQEKERQRIVDSIYSEGRINYESGDYRNAPNNNPFCRKKQRCKDETEKILLILARRIKRFLTMNPNHFSLYPKNQTRTTDDFIAVEVNGEQTVKNDSRLELRLAVDALVDGDSIPRNSLVYGFVSFKANRVFFNITNINHNAVDLKAFDLLDGNEGIYVKNSFTGEARGEVLDDIVQDINIPGVPQVGGIKQVFRRNNRNVKVTIYNQYQLILKPSL